MKCDLVLLADADNTLWDTDSVFADAQLILLSEVEAAVGKPCNLHDRLEFVRRYDQALALRHHLHLKYPPQMLVGALASGLLSQPPEQAAADVIGGRRLVREVAPEVTRAAVEKYLSALSKIPPLLASVREGLAKAIAASAAVYVITEGRSEKQRKIIAAHGLTNVFAGVWELTKTQSQFERLRKRFVAATVVVIGDQPDRDIAPAHAAGCITVFVPGRFRPVWHPPNGASNNADFVAADFTDAVTWTLKHSAAQAM